MNWLLQHRAVTVVTRRPRLVHGENQRSMMTESYIQSWSNHADAVRQDSGATARDRTEDLLFTN